MEVLKDKTDVNKLSFGVIRSLEKRIGIVDVQFEQPEPAEKHVVLQWEQKHACIMPTDLKNFYMMNNGFHLTWSVKVNESKIPVGKMEVNSVQDLVRIGGVASNDTSSLLDIDIDSTDDDSLKTCPKFDTSSRIFELDSCDGFGKTCLVYNNTKPGIPAQNSEVWFLDRSLGWHFLTESFLNYYCLMMTYIGLPQWQYTFTEMGISPAVKQWFCMYAPLKLNTILQEAENETTENSRNVLDANKVFKGKSDKRKQPLGGQRRKTGSSNPMRNSATLSKPIKKS